MPSVRLKTGEGQDYPSVLPEEQGWQEIVSNCLEPYPHHSMIPPTWEFLSFSAQQNFWMARGLRYAPSEPLPGEQALLCSQTCLPTLVTALS